MFKSGKYSGIIHTVITVLEVLVLMAFMMVYLLWGEPLISRILLRPHAATSSLSAEEVEKLTADMTKELESMKTRYSKLTPQNSYIVINTTINEFRLFNNREEVRSGFCSTGSYTKLYTEKRSWVFKTPKGVRKVLSKVVNPVWIKPDWAFIEEGLPVPPAGHPSRYESGTLGDYALALGDGYLIHGTLYQRFLGEPVTHGCVRMGDDDLEAVYKTLKIGSKVYIY